MPALTPGDRAPEFVLPAADREGTVALADYAGHSPVLVTLFRGLYCPFCRHQIARQSPMAERLQAMGIATVGIIATAADRARIYFRLKPSRYRLGADPDLVTHRAYGLSVMARTPAAAEMIDRAARQLALDLDIPLGADDARSVVDRADGWAPLASDWADRERHQIQMTGQFLVDREGVIRWCRNETADTYARFPSAAELGALVAHLPR